jgi:hypothetical protein
MNGVAFVVSALVMLTVWGQVTGQDFTCGWEQSTYSVTEGGSVLISAQFTGNAASVVLSYSTREAGSGSGFAEGNGVDFISVGGVISLDQATPIGSVPLFTVQDPTDEGQNEVFLVDLTSAAGVACDPATATIVIIDDDEDGMVTTPPPDPSDVMWEMNVFELSESNPADVGIVCAVGVVTTSVTVTNIMLTPVNISLDGQPAPTDGTDFFVPVLPTELTFTPSVSRQCIDIFIADDGVPEGTETLRVSFDLPDGSTQTAYVNILDNEDPIIVEWEFDEYTFEEGVNGTYEICAVTDDTIPFGGFAFQVLFFNDTALAEEDYIDNSGTLSFQPGDTRVCVPIDIVDDALIETDECFFVYLLSPFMLPDITKVLIEDDDGDITVNVENEIYTVIEGNELEVCLVTANGLPATFPFYAYTHIDLRPFFPFYFYLRFHFSAGDVRVCNRTSIPGNTYIDKLEREVMLKFYIEESPFSAFVEFDRCDAWLFIADDDLAVVGFSEEEYTAFEDGEFVTVCLELCEGTTNRPIDVLLYSSDDSAIAGINYESTLAIVTIPALGITGTVGCINISIFDDGVALPFTQQFNLAISISDTHVIIPAEKSSAVVIIQPAFEVCFDSDSPAVDGNQLFISFDSTVAVDNATCVVEDSAGNVIASEDCTIGNATITLPAGDSDPFFITVTVRSGDEVRILENNVRSELTGVCDVHLVNKGILINGSIATVYAQPSGPSNMDRIVQLQCRCRDSPSDQPTYEDCFDFMTATSTPSGSFHFEYTIPEDCVILQIRPVDNGNCSPRRGIQIDLRELES